jgi:GDP-L-fucose synthase
MGFYNGKRVLVAGGTGTIGMALVPELQRRGAVVTVVSLDSKAYANSVLPKGVEFFRDDLTDWYECVHHVSRADIVFDMVGIKGSTLTNEKNYSRVFVSYLRFQMNLMDAAAKHKVDRYVFAGSVCSYPRMATPKQEDQMWDGLPLQNDKFSGLVKRVGELQAQAYHEDGTWHGARLVRFSNVYGPGDDFNPVTAQVIPALIAKAVLATPSLPSLHSDVVEVQGNGTAVRDFIYSEDAAFWACEAAEKMASCVPVNLAAGRGITIREVCETIREFVPVEFKFLPQAYSGDPVRILSTDRAKEFLGFHERTTLRVGIQKSIEWYKQNQDISALKGKFYGK